MAIICSICGKKQSGFISDFPLSDNDPGNRICAACEERKQGCIRTLEFNTQNYPNAKKIFLSCVADPIPSVKQELDRMMKDWDNQYQTKFEADEAWAQDIVRKEMEEKAKEAQIAEWNQKFRDMMTTSGFNFEGWRIAKYIKVISAETVLGTGFASEFSASVANLLGTETDKFAKKFEQAKDSSLNKLISKAVDLGANALIGVDFDYPLIYNNIIAVIASATAVVVEKAEE